MIKESESKTSSPLIFFGLAFLLTWACWLPAGYLSQGPSGSLSSILHYAGGMMPTLVALLLLYLCSSPRARRDYWQRLVDFKHISKAWYAVILLTAPILTAAGIVMDRTLGGPGAELEAASTILSDSWSISLVSCLLYRSEPRRSTSPPGGYRL
ncbi:MAG: hypothetical protein AB1894_03265 [Chloroflexota bacterium]